jgi:hypothetical protein
MQHSLRALFFVTLLAAGWLVIFKFCPQVAFLFGCLVPSIGIVLSFKYNSSLLRKCVTIVAFIASLIPAGVVLHASCYFALGTGLITDNRPNVVWLCRTLDQVYFELIDSTCNKKASSRYLQLLSWSFDRGMNLKMMGNEDTHKR